MPLVSGTKLGPYEIVAPLGAGGMGEVYRAKDTRLERTVAIKILKAGDGVRRGLSCLGEFSRPGVRRRLVEERIGYYTRAAWLKRTCARLSGSKGGL